ncbi:UTP--glucose-1-phosphate uridylyltransferase GalU [Exiguobacterium profundum]|uniref:UTP--glucose-1-phosphate uridylyltransferase GalU n=1 Tax=Exiguobacterium TaxID=33986 RepID=UPI0012EF39CF|nr:MULTISPECIES: UTP--glucose-1-phosphate uridylyltransferase GalU [Exiguobacterium]QPI68537.1 UTP--glucose-1-phosphate uridylyltransferase GalU [Exiguobacterium sp. PBE]MCT4799592.1 UTP--glucose-1-phosphate uridylyltransferase GalU [Exiguobacterium profundum]MDT0192157.1 UTP--glucose-1-phosphate uridylyltransferase GalU [Exiguobacterium sp. BG5(2022)]VXB45084.1 UTP-glucose-1-phosphate uridylyltransferase [Exiguobacterium sp. 8A]VXB46393.1 UTP-glucose-1-phosphate uridylyltransferase [Exiguobac
MTRVRKAIIPAAGLGTRFLPATKAMPKEMLPIVNKPTIQFIVEEAVASGIEDIIIVTGKNKRAIEDHFDRALELEQNLESKGKTRLLESVRHSSNLANIHYIRQQEPKGLGHAIWCARKFIGDEPFAVLLGDDIIESDVPATKQLIDQYEAHDRSIIGVQRVPYEMTNRYGIIDPLAVEGKLIPVRTFVEKPPIDEAPSNFAILGRYILKPDVFEALSGQEAGAGGEIQLTDAIARLNEAQTVFAYEFDGRRYDVGEPIGFVETTICHALSDPDLKDDVHALLKRLVDELDQQ